MRKFVDVTPIIEDFKIRGVELNGCDPVVYGIHKGFAEAAKLLSKAKAADVASVIHAEWIKGTASGGFGVTCSNCKMWVGVKYPTDYRYCPACGAQMDVETP